MSKIPPKRKEEMSNSVTKATPERITAVQKVVSEYTKIIDNPSVQTLRDLMLIMSAEQSKELNFHQMKIFKLLEQVKKENRL